MLDINSYFTLTIHKILEGAEANPVEGLKSVLDFIKIFWIQGNHDQSNIGAKDLPLYINNNQKQLNDAFSEITDFILKHNIVHPPMGIPFRVGDDSKSYPSLTTYTIRDTLAEIRTLKECLNSYPLILNSVSEKKYAEMTSPSNWLDSLRILDSYTPVPFYTTKRLEYKTICENRMMTHRNLCGETVLWRGLGEAYPYLPKSAGELDLLSFENNSILIIPRTTTTWVWVGKYGDSSYCEGPPTYELNEVSTLIKYPTILRIKGGTPA